MGYRITYEQGNGYRCGCCRSSETLTEDLETKAEVEEWLTTLAADKVYSESSRWSDPDDREVESIEKEIGVDIQGEFKVDEKLVKIEVQKRKERSEIKKLKEEKLKASEKLSQDHKVLAKLMEDYPEKVKELLS